MKYKSANLYSGLPIKPWDPHVAFRARKSVHSRTSHHPHGSWVSLGSHESHSIESFGTSQALRSDGSLWRKRMSKSKSKYFLEQINVTMKIGNKPL